MTLQAQVKVFPADLASFGGVRLRRMNVTVGGQPYQLLLHELGRMGAFVVSDEGATATSGDLLLKAEWGEPLGTVTALQVDAESGRVLGYSVQVRVRDSQRNGGAVTIELGTDAVFWWNGELCCNKRAAYFLRDVQRGRRDPRMPLPTARGRLRADAA